jgi:chaperone required for assembly of F1-ATPase
MNSKRPKRFYSQVEIKRNGTFAILLDGRPLKTPLKRDLILPSAPLAKAIAAEWAAQGERIDPEQMLITKLANTAIDRVAGDRRRVIGELVQYASSDLVCYRAAEPESLAARQGELWDPVLTWAEETLGVGFFAIQGVVHKPQPEDALRAVARYLGQFDAMSLSALYNLTTLAGSVLIALALESGFLEPERAWLAAHVDEDWQIERWGRDEDAAQRRSRRREEFDATVNFLNLVAPLRSSSGLTQ